MTFSIPIVFCVTFLCVIVIYWIMPINKMKAVNHEIVCLLQLLPISKILEVFKKDNAKSNR